MPDGKPFRDFLTGMNETGTCTSCITGGGNPDCAIRICAKEKSAKVCAFCKSFPCRLIDPILATYPGLLSDNELLRDKGWEKWGRLQKERHNPDSNACRLSEAIPEGSENTVATAF